MFEQLKKWVYFKKYNRVKAEISKCAERIQLRELMPMYGTANPKSFTPIKQ